MSLVSLTNAARRRDLAAVGLILIALTAVYRALAQVNMSYDSVMFVFWYSRPGFLVHPHHPLFTYLLAGLLRAGAWIGLGPLETGFLHAAAFSAFAMALVFLFLRRAGVSAPVAALYTALLALNGSLLETATDVELYALTLTALAASLLAFQSIETNKSRLAAIGLWASGFAVLALHLGFAFWILALYTALAWKDIRRPRRMLGWLGQGFSVGLAVALWLWAEGLMSAEEMESSRDFIEMFWGYEGGGYLQRAIQAPAFDFSAFGGMALFPAVAGVVAFWGARPCCARLFITATAAFFGFFPFWISYYGTFYLPVQVVWTLFAALAMDKILRGSRQSNFLWGGFGVFWFLPCVLLPLERLAPLTDLFRTVVAGSFWALAAAQILAGRALRRDADSPVARRLSLGAFGAVSALLLGMTLAAYLPRAVQLTRPDDLLREVRAFREIASPDARFITALVPPRPQLAISNPCISIWEEDQARFERIAGWLRERRQADLSGEDAPLLILDRQLYLEREELWRLLGSEAPPQDQFDFNPIPSGDFVFYAVISAGV